ncbi:MAG TPA: FtsH protease activity modulator HflK [Polyangiales bacterium]|nr:FtsH protease activity modulator HflK [Polyangiales bacterium]
MIRARTLIIGLLAVYALTGVYFVEPDEQVIVRRFGRAEVIAREPGAQWGLPAPFDLINRLRPRETKRVALGLPDTATGAVTTGATQLLTGDRNLVNVKATVQYTVADSPRYLFASSNVEQIVRTTAEAILTEALARQGVDRALTLGKRELAIEVEQRLQKLTDQYGLGITVRSVDLGSVEPPPEVAASFDQVTGALRQREQAINEARGYDAQTSAESQGAAQRERDQARGFHDRTIAEAQGENERYTKLLAEYRRQPALTSTRLYLEAMTEVLPRLRSKLIVDSGKGLDVSIMREDAPRDGAEVRK